MKFTRTSWVGTLAATALACFALPQAHAVCGVPAPVLRPSRFELLPASPLLRTAAWEDEEAGSIVGFWHVKFVSKGSGKVAPDGAEIDAGYSQWHSDHTEIMNSGGRSPLVGDFCLGVWKQVGERTFKLNHFAAGWDATASNLVGPANIRETLTVDRDGQCFTGTFTIDQYTEAGNLVVHLQGIITGTRMNVTTPPTSVLKQSREIKAGIATAASSAGRLAHAAASHGQPTSASW